MKQAHSPTIRSICVYCGSSPGNDPEFEAQARQLGLSLAKNDLRLVYGGGDRGLMGATARGVLEGGGQVLGIIPEFLKQKEQSLGTANLEGAKMVTVPDMHTRKNLMFEEADAFIALPGGIGTLEELVEILTWAQLGRHTKPVALLNINDFWSPYMELIAHMSEAGFLHNPDRARPLVFEDAKAVVPGFMNHAA